MNQNIAKWSLKAIITTMVLASSLYACNNVYDPIYYTSHPSGAKLNVATNWSQRTDGVNIPGEYIVRVGGKSAPFTDLQADFPHILPVGSMRLHIYHAADDVSVMGNVVSVATVSPSKSAEPTILSNPGWLFTAAADITLEADKVNTLSVNMQQQIRQLTLIIKPTGDNAGNIASIDARLGGITQSWDFDKNIPVGSTASVVPKFIKQADGTWQATLRLLGTGGSYQHLIVNILYMADALEGSDLASDLSDHMKDFNRLDDAAIPMTLEAAINVNSDATTQAGFSCTISDWKRTDRNGIAN